MSDVMDLLQNASIAHWLALGAPAEKLLLGFPTYGRTYRLSTGANGLGAPANGAAEPGPYTRTAGFWAYYEVWYFWSKRLLVKSQKKSC